MAEEDAPPPLEDMSEMIRQVDNLRDIRKTKKSNAAQAALNNASRQDAEKPINTAMVFNNNNSHSLSSTGASAMSGGASAMPDVISNNAVAGAVGGAQGAVGGADARPKIKNKNQTFGGFQKGFLFNATASGKHDKRTNETRNLTESNTAVAKKTYNKDMPFIKPKVTNREKDLEMPEVQQAMQASEGLLQNKEWLTEDLLSRIQGNETLSRRITDPTFMQAIGEFQSDPHGAMLKYQRNPEIQNFLKEFCGLIGDHFTKFGSKQDIPVRKPARDIEDGSVNVLNSDSANAIAPPDEEERRMQEILANPEIRQILIDPNVQRLIQTIRSNPEQGQSIFHSSDPEMRRKIKKLVEVGLLAFQT